jgi:deoxyribodipyrimidine photo-lyase
MTNTAIIWFKTDLRLSDNETLIKALASHEYIVPVYCFDEAHFKETAFGFKKTGAYKAQFLLESVEDLKLNLQRLGSDLLVVHGKPEIELLNIAKMYHAQAVFAKAEIAYEEINTERQVQNALLKQGCILNTYHTHTLYHPQDLPFESANTPDVFTNFRRAVEKQSTIRSVFEPPVRIHSPTLPKSDLPTLASLGLLKQTIDTRAVLPFKGGETAAMNRLKHYFFETQSLSTYKLTRNGLMGANYSSKFSPWLALGCLSARTIFKHIKQYEDIYAANDSTYWLQFELLWRDFFQFIFVKYPTQLFQITGIHQETYTQSVKPIIANKTNKFALQSLQNWINGNTPNTFINANMRELNATGFMSNRGRQNVASYFCHHLKLDWRWGAAYFEHTLIDYDVCSNWGNWAYIAGVGNDPRPSRVFNIEKQAHDYDEKGEYRQLWL